MKKQTSASDLRKLLLKILKKYEESFCTNVAMSLVLKEHGLLTGAVDKLSHSNDISATVHRHFAPLIAAIEHEDDEALLEALLRMPMPGRVM
jgi:hypothetical protein